MTPRTTTPDDTDGLGQARGAASIFDPQRLRVARHAEKLTRRGLADLVGVSATAVSQWEASATRPRPQTVARLAQAIDYPADYFATSGRHVSNLDSSCSFFRSLKESSQRDRDAAAAHAALIAELVLVIERRVALPDIQIPRHPANESTSLHEVDSIAQDVREAWDLGHQPIADVLREIERHGATAARLALADNVDAFSWPGYGRPIVILGVNKQNRIRSRFDAAHELGHLVMHRDHPRPADPILERQAHRFASAFLLPAACLRHEWPAGRIDWRALMEVKRRWQISLAALLYRARQDNLITETSYASATRYMARAGWRVTEPGDEGLPERPRMLEEAVRALGSAGISIGDLAREARLPRRLVDDYVNPAVPRRINVSI